MSKIIKQVVAIVLTVSLSTAGAIRIGGNQGGGGGTSSTTDSVSTVTAAQ